ncbi:HAD family hydrolase [Paenibacillus cineris]|uniref:Hydrolase n=1 Tax=Paenibacillus cineris TaxID=237530 RepID=A0ABQ4LD75_9BACL|nr:HAD family phosphatase [Paenibacillus cineris]GIO54408.1 hydrolase [Paenibacillus cineris]
MFKAIAFDMDGVLIDTQSSVKEFWNQVATGCGIRLEPSDFDQFIYGCQASYTLDRLFPKLTSIERAVVLSKLESYEATMTYQEIIGVSTFLASVREAGVKTALVTSASPSKVNEVIYQMKWQTYFDVIVTAEHIAQGKPAPDCYLLAAERLNVDPGSCIVFEDARSGVRSAVAAGMYVAGVGLDRLLKGEGAAVVVDNFKSVKLVSKNGGSSKSHIHIGEVSVPIRTSYNRTLGSGKE